MYHYTLYCIEKLVGSLDLNSIGKYYYKDCYIVIPSMVFSCQMTIIYLKKKNYIKWKLPYMCAHNSSISNRAIYMYI